MQQSKVYVLIKEENQRAIEIPCDTPDFEFDGDGTGVLMQSYNFGDKSFKAYYEPSDEDWSKGIVIFKLDKFNNESNEKDTIIIELKLVEFKFPTVIGIANGKYLKFKRYDKFKDKDLNLHFSFKMYYTDENSDEYILLERQNNVLKSAPSLSILLNDTILEEIEYLKEDKNKLFIDIKTESKDYLDCTMEVLFDIDENN